MSGDKEKVLLGEGRVVVVGGRVIGKTQRAIATFLISALKSTLSSRREKPIKKVSDMLA